MKRLDYTRRSRSVRGNARNAAEAVMVLAQLARERHRLEQERRTLEKRMRHIQVRLTEIAGTETKLVPVIQLAHQAGPAPATVAAPASALAGGVGDITLQY